MKVDYKRLGRGLVYNCRSKFWACLNKKEYLNCRGNLKWSKLNKKEENVCLLRFTQVLKIVK